MTSESTQQLENTSRPRQPARRLAWTALVFAVLSLMLIVLARADGGPIPWTSWTLPALLVANTGMALLPWARRHPSIAIVYHRLSAAAAVIILLAITWQLWHR